MWIARTVWVAVAVAVPGLGIHGRRPHNDTQVQMMCSDSSTDPVSSFRNPFYPSEDYDIGSCDFTVIHMDNICQLRLDFLEFELSQPNDEGRCVSDTFIIDGLHSHAPKLCGSNTGQHMYVEVEPSGWVVRLLVEKMEDALPRKWNIKVTQIPCGSIDRAPPGCLQYYTSASDTISSFNFKQLPPTPPSGTRQLQGMKYGICVGEDGSHCGVEWTRNTIGGHFGFTVSGNAITTNPMLLGNPIVSQTGQSCLKDYVVIPGGVDDMGFQADRYCGLGFPNKVYTKAAPFVLYVRTDDNEYEEEGKHGFSLDYHQILC